MNSHADLHCHCPFCAPRRLSLKVPSLDLSRKFHVWILIVLLIVRGGLSGPVRRQSADLALLHTSDKLGKDNDPSTGSLQSQKLYVNPNTSLGPQCNKDEDCYCYSIGKCRRCSRLDISRQLGECLVTGYKQRAYCPNIKKKKYISCHFVEDPQEARLFWLFEGSAFTIGAVAYTIAILRMRKIERTVARRIQQQINA